MHLSRSSAVLPILGRQLAGDVGIQHAATFGALELAVLLRRTIEVGVDALLQLGTDLAALTGHDGAVSLDVGRQALRLHCLGVGRGQQVASLDDVGDVGVGEVLAVLAGDLAHDLVERAQHQLGHVRELAVAHLVAQLFPEVGALAEHLRHEGRGLLVELRLVVVELLEEAVLVLCTEQLQQLRVQRLALLLGQAVVSLVDGHEQRRIL